MLAELTRTVVCAAIVSGLVSRSPVRVEAAPAKPTIEEDARERARLLFLEGSEAFKQARYDDAIAAFRRAYESDPVAALLLNIAQAARLKTPPDCAEALRHYELYLAAEPRAAERPEIERNMAAMRTCLDERAARATTVQPQAVEPPRKPKVAPPPPPASAGAAPWITAGGAVLALAGAGLYTRARFEWNELEPTCPCPDDTIDTWEAITNVSYGLMAVGVLTTAVGAAWWWRGAARESPSTLALIPWATFEQRGLALGGRF